MSENFDLKYHSCVRECRKLLEEKDQSGIYSLSNKFREIFNMLLERIELKKDSIGDDIEEFTESACYEICMQFIEDFGFFEYLAYLPLIAKFIACESSVAYSISGVVDVLDSEYRPQRIAGAYLSALLYLIQVQIK